MISIEKIYIDGFKNIHELNLDLSKINGILSANNYGKSNVLQAISFAVDFITGSVGEKKRMMGWKPGVPCNISDLNKNFKIEFIFNSLQGKESFLLKYGFEFVWKAHKKDFGIIRESLKVKKDDTTQKYMTYIDRYESIAKYKSSISGRCDKDISIDKNELIVNKISAYDDLFYLDIIKEINDLKIFVDRHFDAEKSYAITPIIEKNVDLASPFNDSSIARILYFLKKEHKKKYDLIINTLKDFFPYITEIKIREIDVSEKNKDVKITEEMPFELADNIYILMANSKFMAQTISFSMMSDGAKRILSLLIYMTLADMNGIPLIGIEEPENSIHPGLLKKYVDVIDGFMENSKVIITSHSPYLINYLGLNNLYLGLSNEQGRAIFKRITSSGANKINSYATEIGSQAGEYLFSIISGVDEFDKELLRKCLAND